MSNFKYMMVGKKEGNNPVLYKITGPGLPETGHGTVMPFCYEQQAQAMTKALEFAWESGLKLGWFLVEPFQPVALGSYGTGKGVIGLGLETKEPFGFQGEALAEAMNAVYREAAFRKTGVKIVLHTAGYFKLMPAQE